MIRVVPPRGDGDWEQFVQVRAQSFGMSLTESAERAAKQRAHGLAMFALEDDRVVGGALALRTGQFFGGRPVPAGAVCAVCVLPEYRGRGVGARVMSAIDHALLDAGVAVAPLWPSSIRFYRLCGWEVTERGHRHAVAIRSFRHLTGEGDLLRDPGKGVFTLQRECAMAWNGPLDRPDWWWEERHSAYPSRGVPPEHRSLYGWSQDRQLTGFLEYLVKPSTRRGLEITVAQLWTTTPDALKGLCGVLGSHEAQVDEVIFPFWVLPNSNDLLWLLPEAERTVQTEGRLAWMLRLIDPAAALEARGWPATIASLLELEVTDPLRHQTLHIILEVADGRASVTPGGSGRVRLGAGALASWYAGALRASHGARLGLVQASPADLEVMDSMTADRPVWLPEYF